MERGAHTERSRHVVKDNARVVHGPCAERGARGCMNVAAVEEEGALPLLRKVRQHLVTEGWMQRPLDAAAEHHAAAVLAVAKHRPAHDHGG
eukprot:143505-Prymnesium_polylepis.1